MFNIKHIQLKLVSYMYQIQRYENCMIGNSSLQICMVQHVFSIKHVQLKFAHTRINKFSSRTKVNVHSMAEGSCCAWRMGVLLLCSSYEVI